LHYPGWRWERPGPQQAAAPGREATGAAGQAPWDANLNRFRPAMSGVVFAKEGAG